MMNSTLILNPHATLVPQYLNDSAVGVRVVAPIKGRQLTTTMFLLETQRSLTEILLGFLGDTPDTSPEFANEELEMLVSAGLLVEPDAVPEYPSFRVPLVNSVHKESLLQGGEEDLLVHPDIRVATDDERPKVFSAGPVLWVPNLATGLALPYWDDERAIRDLVPGTPLPSEMPSAVRASLIAVGAVVTPSRLREQRRAFNLLSTELRATLDRNGYLVAKSLLPDDYSDSLAHHYRALISEGFLHFKDRITETAFATRFVKHQDPIAAKIHDGLSSFVSEIAGTRVKPSYSFVSSYEPGAELLRHVDRAQCEYSLSLQLGYAPDRALAPSWPIYLDTPAASRIPVRLSVGDALLYRGRQLPHYRHALPDGHRSVHIFFHFVDCSFDGPLE